MTDDDLQDQLAEDIAEIKRWTRIQGLESLSRILDHFDDVDLVIYDEADGETYLSDIEEEVGLDSTTISHRLSEWGELGIVEKNGQQWEHLAPLSAMGIERPKISDEE